MIPISLSGGFSGSTSKSSATETSKIDEWLRKRQEAMLASAEGDLAASYRPTTAAQVDAQMNPFTRQIVDRMYANADTGRRQALNQVADRAAAAGAFGGSRHGVAEGVALGEFDRNLGDQATGLLHEGFREAAERALDENRYGYAYPMARYGVLGDLLSRITPEETRTKTSKSRDFGWKLDASTAFGG